MTCIEVCKFCAMPCRRQARPGNASPQSARSSRRELLFDTHQHYEESGALAATGQMPENEVADFRTHLADCPECSALLADFARTGAYLAAGHAPGQRNHEVPDGMTERFIARARTLGIA